jgi:hypothetical protein
MKLLTWIGFAFIFTSFTIHVDFLSEQKKFERVRTSIQDKGPVVAETLKKYGLEPGNVNILIIAYKTEDVLEVYAKKKSASVYRKIASYDICASSGIVGPKRKAGDNRFPKAFIISTGLIQIAATIYRWGLITLIKQI